MKMNILKILNSECSFTLLFVMFLGVKVIKTETIETINESVEGSMQNVGTWNVHTKKLICLLSFHEKI